MKNLIFGIDPDVDKSGVAYKDRRSRDVEFVKLDFFQLQEWLKAKKNDIRTVYLEAGWLNKSVWHSNKYKGVNVAGRIGRNVGANHAVGKKIEEMLIHLGFVSAVANSQCVETNVSYYELVRPTSAKWGKEIFKKITGIERRSNQDERDAVKLIWGRA